MLAEDVEALCDLPAFDASAMDGWAVCGTGPWRIVGQLLAGQAPAGGLDDGEALWVATGAPVPAGTSGVLQLEHGTVVGDQLWGDVAPGRHVRRRGEELHGGEVVVPAGSVLSPAAIGLAAAVGHDHLLVVPRPAVALLVTGSELQTSGLPSGGRVRDALGPALPALVERLGGDHAGTGHLADGDDELFAALTDVSADVVLVSGSSSVGRADSLGRVLRRLDAAVLVDGVDVRPGHPMLLARLPGGPWLVGLPGNPLAALASLLTLGGPLVGALAGLAPMALPRADGRALDRVEATRLVPVRLVDGRAVPTGHDGSAMLRGAAVADALAVVEPGHGDVELLPL